MPSFNIFVSALGTRDLISAYLVISPATSGTTYPVVAGDTYYIKVEKSGFTAVAFTYKAQPGALPLVVAMTAA